jgi:hypothetical protein
MTPENFNLQIQTPETGDNDEIKQLKAEMMSYKPLIDDAIKRQNVQEAEELFAKAKELKAKLKELKNKEKGIYQIQINGEKLELGPTLGEMTWDEIPAKLEEINKTLKPGEKPWRLPTKEEYNEIEAPIVKIAQDEFLREDKKIDKIKEKIGSLGFTGNVGYWSGSNSDSFDGGAWVFDIENGLLYESFKNNSGQVRFIR